MFCRPLPPDVKRFWIQVTMTTQYKSTLVLAILLLAASAAPAESPYPPSPLIADISLDWSTHERHALGSDNWQLTWADDDHQYGAWGDGGGFPEATIGTDAWAWASDASKASGTTTRASMCGEARTPENPAQFSGKSWGTISIGGVLYSWITPDDPDTGGQRDHYPLHRTGPIDGPRRPLDQGGLALAARGQPDRSHVPGLRQRQRPRPGRLRLLLFHPPPEHRHHPCRVRPGCS